MILLKAFYLVVANMLLKIKIKYCINKINKKPCKFSFIIKPFLSKNR